MTRSDFGPSADEAATISVSDERPDYVPPESTIEYARTAVREAILMGRLAPGSRVSAVSLAGQLGISHIPVREALRALEGEGQLVRSARRGSFVPDVSLEDARDLYHWRRIIEDEAHKVAVPRVGADVIVRLRRLAEAMYDVANRDERLMFARLNRLFHFAVFDLSRSAYLHHLIEYLWDSEARYHAIAYRSPGALRVANEQHGALTECYAAGDIRGANRVMEEHRLVTLRAIEAVLAKRQDVPRPRLRT